MTSDTKPKAPVVEQHQDTQTLAVGEDPLMDVVFQALAHARRRQMLDLVSANPGLTVGKLASNFDISRIGVMQHLTVLEKAGLIIPFKQGRTRQLYVNMVPIQQIHERWTDTYGQYFASHLTGLKDRAEARAMARETVGEDDGSEKELTPITPIKRTSRG